MISVTDNQKPFVPSKKFLGYGNFKIIDINPSKEKLEGYMHRELENFTGYVGKTNEGVDYVKISFILQKPEEDTTVPIIKKDLFLRRQIRKNFEGTKTQVIDKYGNTAWVTDEQFKNQEVPLSNKGTRLPIATPYRPCCVGEADLVDFIKAWTYSPNSFAWENMEFKLKDEEALKSCEIQLDHIKDYWEGDFSELTDLLKIEHLMKHDVWALLILREGEFNGRKAFFQDVYNRVIPSFKDPMLLEKEFMREVAAGRHKNERYDFKPLYDFAIQDNQQSMNSTTYTGINEINKPYYDKVNAEISAKKEQLAQQANPYISMPPVSKQPAQTVNFDNVSPDDLPF